MKRLAAVLIATSCLQGQVSKATLLGTVRDQAGAVVAGASVQVENQATSFRRSAISDKSGDFQIADLSPGSYTISANKAGFRTTFADSVRLEVNQIARLDLDLKVGDAAEVITVEAEVTPLRTEEASQGLYLEAATIKMLPLLGRNILTLMTLPASNIPRHLGGFTHDVVNDVQASRGAVMLNAPANGARSSLNAYVLDGVYNTDRNSYAIALVPPLESVQEFRITTSLAGAQFPQAGGALMDVVTKSGTRDFHGNAFDYLRNGITDARGLFATPDLPRPVYRQNQFGASLGGPLLSNTVFFTTYEGVRGLSAKSTLHRFPDAQLRSGDFSGGAPIYDPLTVRDGVRLAFPGNIIPPNRISPIARKFLDQYEPLPNLPETGTSNYVDATPNRTANNHGSVRVDHSLRSAGSLFGRYTINDDDTILAGAFPELPTHEQLRAQQATLGHSLAGTSWVNEVRASFTRLRVFDLPQSAFQKDVVSDLGIRDFPSDPFHYGLPYFVITNFETVTDSTFLPQIQRNNSWYFADRLSHVRRSLTLHAGLEGHVFQMNYLQSRFPRGQYIFNGTFTSADGSPDGTGDPLADFLLGFAQRTTRSVGSAQAYLRQRAIATYLQADWKATPKVTLNAGVRYEYVSPFTEKRDQMSNLDYSSFPGAPKLVQVHSAFEPNRTNFAPRVGFAARLRPSTVLRGGYGIYFNPEIATEAYDLVRNSTRTEINETTGLTPSLTLANGFPSGAIGGFPSYYGLDRKLPTPYMQQWNVSLQKELARSVVVETAYVGTKGTHLGRFRRFNTPLHVETGENLDPRPGDLQALRTFPQLGPIFQRQHIANSSYNALQLKVETRASSRLMLSAGFTWAKSIDDADSIIPGQYDSMGAQDERNLRLERGLSFFDVRRRLSAAFTYDIPAVPHMRWLTRNWSLGGILTLQDGTPLNPVYFGTDIANSGTPNRPNVVAGQEIKLPRAQRSLDLFFNTDAFSTPEPYTFGNAGRNIIPGPGNQVLDVALQRRFTLRENVWLLFRAEAFNALNHPNVGIPGPYPDFGPFFGRIFSSGEPRRFQFAARVEF